MSEFAGPLWEPRTRAPASLRFSKTEANRRRGAAFRPVWSTTGRTEYRDQGLVRFAIDRAVSLHRADVGGPCISLGALFSGGPLRSLRALRTGLPLRARNTLYALRALRTCRSLRARITLGAWIFATCSERKRYAHDEYRKNPHVEPPLV
jgi:hypothetical protein